jgi:hypothetical protein
MLHIPWRVQGPEAGANTISLEGHETNKKISFVSIEKVTRAVNEAGNPHHCPQ